MPNVFTETDCNVLENSNRIVHDFQLTGESVDLPMLGHSADNPKTYKAMTFSGQIPGPTVRVTQGDVIKMTLTIPPGEPTAHGNDMHAAQISSENFDAVQPGSSKTYCFIAKSAGIFKYHCTGVNLAAMDQHVLSGMYGIAIVDPARGYENLIIEKTIGSAELDRKYYSADALEFQLQFNQLYLTDGGFYDQGAMFQGELTSRPDSMELIKHLYHLNLPITVITNCSLLHEVDLDELKKYIQFITCSIDSVFEDSYCKVRGVRPEIFQRVMNNLDLLNQHNVPHYFKCHHYKI